jgi:hypothetical protein
MKSTKLTVTVDSVTAVFLMLNFLRWFYPLIFYSFTTAVRFFLKVLKTCLYRVIQSNVFHLGVSVCVCVRARAHRDALNFSYNCDWFCPDSHYKHALFNCLRNSKIKF